MLIGTRNKPSEVDCTASKASRYVTNQTPEISVRDRTDRVVSTGVAVIIDGQIILHVTWYANCTIFIYCDRTAFELCAVGRKTPCIESHSLVSPVPTYFLIFCICEKSELFGRFWKFGSSGDVMGPRDPTFNSWKSVSFRHIPVFVFSVYIHLIRKSDQTAWWLFKKIVTFKIKNLTTCVFYWVSPSPRGT